jgi:hypothetical protein
VCGASTVDWVDIDHATVTADPDSSNGVFLPFSQTTRIRNSVFYIPKNLSLWLVNKGLVSQSTYRALWDGNYFRLEHNSGIYANSGTGWDVDFRHNTVRVSSPVADTSVMALAGLAVIEGNSFLIASSGHPGGGNKVAIQFARSKYLRDNRYSTDLVTAGANYFSNSLTGVIEATGEMYDGQWYMSAVRTAK